MDWVTRKVLSWRLSNTLDACFCVEALEESIAKYGMPEIMNTDQGSQNAGADWITTLTKGEIKISMDGQGRYLDNLFIERLWRFLKQEAAYLLEITNVFQAKRIRRVDRLFITHNTRIRPSTSTRPIRHVLLMKNKKQRHDQQRIHLRQRTHKIRSTA